MREALLTFWRIRKALLACLLVLIVPMQVAWSDPGTNGLTTDAVVNSTNSCVLRSGRVCFFAFGSPIGNVYTGNSGVFSVPKTADICINSDTGSNINSGAVATIYRVVNANTLNGSMQPSAASSSVLTFATGDCFAAITGLYWVETTTNPSSTVVAVISVTERN